MTLRNFSLNSGSKTLILATAGLVALAAATGCRGQKSKNPPIHPNLNMDFQYHQKAQEASDFFEDGRTMRPNVPGTISRGSLVGTEEMRTGKNGDAFLTANPVPLSNAMVIRGQERYDIYCTPCHGAAGYADGIVTKRGNLPPPSFHDDRLRAMSDGEIYGAIINGVRGNMPSYSGRLSVSDRWAVVAYVRALQVSQNADLEDVPADISREKGWN